VEAGDTLWFVGLDDGDEKASAQLGMCTDRKFSGSVCARLSSGREVIWPPSYFPISQLRLAQGLSQADVAQATGLSQPTIARVEAGKIVPKVTTVVAMARALGVDPVDYFRLVCGLAEEVLAAEIVPPEPFFQVGSSRCVK